MRAFVEQNFDCVAVQWDEPTDGGAVFTVVRDGEWITAESVAILISALSVRRPVPLRLAA